MKNIFAILVFFIALVSNSYAKVRHGGVTPLKSCRIVNFVDHTGLVHAYYYQPCQTVGPNGTSRCSADGRCSIGRVGVPDQTGDTVSSSIKTPVNPRSN